MKVKELIEALQRFDPELEVVTCDENWQGVFGTLYPSTADIDEQGSFADTERLHDHDEITKVCLIAPA